jgi:uncharacterized protein YciI
MAECSPNMDMDRFTLVLLRRPPDAPELSERDLDALQARHVAYLRSLREGGAMLVAGPFAGQPDESWRGMCVYVIDVDEARRLAERDPAVLAGRLAVDVMTWLVPSGLLPKQPATGA